ncbi:hypothetical protein BGW80DRAFT_1165079 [Lactifluus volemus]|nr:hypothetical protein BGW80DRAFT_1165079 [Lactifluus volemus]
MKQNEGLETRSRKILFATIWFMFILSTIYWILSVAATFVLITDWFSSLDPKTIPDPASWLPMFNAILLINYILTDGVVAWRAWVLCPEQSKVILMIPIVTLVINSLFYFATVGVRIALYLYPRGQGHTLSHIIDVTQVGNIVFSLLTNLLATSIISVKAWSHRTSLSHGSGSINSPVSNILALLVESGILYIVITVTNVVCLVVHVPFGTVGDVFTPIGVQLAGIYPIIVVLLVDRNRSLNNTTFYSSGSIVINTSRDQHSRLGPMVFSSAPQPLSSSQGASEKRGPQLTNPRLTLGSIVDTRGVSESLNEDEREIA